MKKGIRHRIDKRKISEWMTRINMNFHKVFDKVTHKRLCKRKACGIGVVHWGGLVDRPIRNKWLSFRVAGNDHEIVQETVLGPQIFTWYINILDRDVSTIF